MILYLFTGSYKCRLTTFPTRFAHVISILRYCHCFASLKVLCHEQMNKYHQITLRVETYSQSAEWRKTERSADQKPPWAERSEVMSGRRDIKWSLSGVRRSESPVNEAAWAVSDILRLPFRSYALLDCWTGRAACRYTRNHSCVVNCNLHIFANCNLWRI